MLNRDVKVVWKNIVPAQLSLKSLEVMKPKLLEEAIHIFLCYYRLLSYQAMFPISHGIEHNLFG